MKTFLTFLLLIGLSHSAILDSKESTKSKTDWDDEDSMILPSSSSPPPLPQEKNADDINIEFRPKFISLIPKENNEESRYEYTADHSQPEAESEDESSTSVTPSTEEEGGSISDASLSTEETNRQELPKTHLMQLGKIPLKLKVVPLLPPVHDQLLGSQNEKPEDFSDKGEVGTTDKVEQQKSGEEEASDDVVRARGEQNLPATPLTYMIPPRMNEEDYWRKYPLVDEAQNGQEQSTTFEADKESQDAPTFSINPILERLNDFLQKAKRHSIEQQHLREQDASNINNDSQSEEDAGEISAKESSSTPGGPINFDSDEVMSGMQSSTTESVENSETMSPPPQPEFPEDNSYRSLVSQQVPQLYTPKIMDYQPESQPLPYMQTLSAPSMDQIRPDYYNFQNGQRASINPYLYSSPRINDIPSTPIPKESVYIPNESYWLRKYLYDRILNENRVTSPYSRGYYNEYFRPQRNSYLLPSSSLLNSIQDDRAYYPSFPYGGEETYGNFVPRSSLELNRLYYNPSSYVLNQRPYLSSLSYYNTPAVNDFMYAPLYSYQRYRSIPPSPQPDFF